MIKIAIADPTGDFTYLFRLGIKLYPPKNGEEISIERYDNNKDIQDFYTPGKYDIVIINYRSREFPGDLVPNYIRQMDKNVVIAAYLKENFLYVDQSDLGYYELSGRRPPDYERTLEKLYEKCRPTHN